MRYSVQCSLNEIFSSDTSPSISLKEALNKHGQNHEETTKYQAHPGQKDYL